MIQLIVSVILFFVIFFGIAFTLNMLLRRTWLMAFVYPFIVLFIVDKIPMSNYFTSPGEASSKAFSELFSINGWDVIILTSGFIGTIVSGIVIKILRKNGYRMF